MSCRRKRIGHDRLLSRLQSPFFLIPDQIDVRAQSMSQGIFRIEAEDVVERRQRLRHLALNKRDQGGLGPGPRRLREALFGPSNDLQSLLEAIESVKRMGLSQKRHEGRRLGLAKLPQCSFALAGFKIYPSQSRMGARISGSKAQGPFKLIARLHPLAEVKEDFA